MAFPTGWGRKCEIVIDNTKVSGSGSHTDFPVYITEANLPSEMFDADGSYPALDGGGDIRFSSDSSGATQLACQVVRFTTDNNPANGKADIYVKVPTLSATADTTIYVWYNKVGETQPAATATYGSQAAWNTDYAAVYVTPMLSLQLEDSTTNARHMEGGVGTYKQVPLWDYDSTITPVPNVHQGVYYDEAGGYWYGFDDNAIYKYSTLGGSAEASNTDVCGDVDTYIGSGTRDHVGAGFVEGDYVYVGVNYYNGCVDRGYPVLAKFNKSDLSFVSAVDISASSNAVAALCCDPNEGTNGTIYAVDYCDGSKIWKYDLSDFSSLGSISLSSNYGGHQGITLWAGGFIISATGGGGRLPQYLFDGTLTGLANIDFSDGPTVKESVQLFTDGTLYWFDGSTTESLQVFKHCFDQYRAVYQGANSASLRLTYTLPDNGTITNYVTPTSWFDFNFLFDNSASVNYWKGTFDASGGYRARISTAAIIYDPGTTATEKQQHVQAWTKAGSNVGLKLYANGYLGNSTTQAWATPGTYVYLNGGQSSPNDQGNNKYHQVLISSVERSADWLATEYQSYVNTSTFSTAGTPSSGATLSTYTLTAGTGAFTTTGVAAGLKASRAISCGVGSFTTTGVSAGLVAARKISAGVGSFTTTGYAADLVYTPVGGSTYTLAAGVGAFTTTGISAGLVAARKLSAGIGAFTTTGYDAILTKAYVLTAGIGSFTTTGVAASLIANRVLTAGTGAFTTTGYPANLTTATAPSLSAADLDAIWAYEPVPGVSAKTMLAEIWGRLGLNATAPLVTSNTAISFDAVFMDIAESSGQVTVTRQ